MLTKQQQQQLKEQWMKSQHGQVCIFSTVTYAFDTPTRMPRIFQQDVYGFG